MVAMGLGDLLRRQSPSARLNEGWPKFAAAALVVTALGAGGAWKFYLQPKKADADLRFATMNDLSTLFALQLQYKKDHGVYANEVDELITEAPDRAALKARLAAHVDTATIAIRGDADKFKIELNMLDAQRTLFKIKGPIESPRRSTATVVVPPTAPPLNADGVPLVPAR